MRGRTGFILGLVLGLMFTGGWIAARAAIPSSDGTITACYVKPSSALRIIDAAASSCKKGETPITWNQQGVPGQPGVFGEHIVQKAVQVTEGSDRTQGIVECPDGEVAISGGVSAPAAADHQWFVGVSQPIANDDALDLSAPTGWLGVATTVGGGGATAGEAQLRSMSLRVVCAQVAQ